MERPHGLIPIFDANKNYTWMEVSVVGYDKQNEKYIVKLSEFGKEKAIGRLSLRFI